MTMFTVSFITVVGLYYGFEFRIKLKFYCTDTVDD
jgi:hypothetical protein